MRRVVASKRSFTTKKMELMLVVVMMSACRLHVDSDEIIQTIFTHNKAGIAVAIGFSYQAAINNKIAIIFCCGQCGVPSAAVLSVLTLMHYSIRFG